MLGVKKLLGWLCVVLFVLVCYFATVYVCDISAPFFAGGEIQLYDMQLNPPLLAELALDVSRNPGIGGLYDFAEHSIKPAHRVKGLEAILWRLQQTSLPAYHEPTPVAAMALIDNGTVAAAYPLDLAKELPLEAHLKPFQWEALVEAEGSKLVSGAGFTSFYNMRGLNGKETKGVAVLWKKDAAMISIPAGMKVISSRTILQHKDRVIAYFIALALLMPLWVGMDAHWRGMRPLPWGLLVLIVGFIGFGAYLVARLSSPRQCPNCGGRVLGKYRRCPLCGVELLPDKCPKCRTPLRPEWQFCPICAGPGQGVDDEAGRTPVDLPEADEKPAGIKVIVLDDVTRQPVRNATVSIQGPTSLQGQTGSEGSFDAYKLRSGSYQISAMKEGCEAAEAQIDLAEHSWKSVELLMKPLPGGIRGRVVASPSQIPVSGARVYLDTSRVNRESITNIEGAYLLDDVPAGPYTVRVEFNGFVAQSKLVHVRQGAGVTLDFVLEACSGTAVEQVR